MHGDLWYKHHSIPSEYISVKDYWSTYLNSKSCINSLSQASYNYYIKTNFIHYFDIKQHFRYDWGSDGFCHLADPVFLWYFSRWYQGYCFIHCFESSSILYDAWLLKDMSANWYWRKLDAFCELVGQIRVTKHRNSVYCNLICTNQVTVIGTVYKSIVWDTTFCLV